MGILLITENVSRNRAAVPGVKASGSGNPDTGSSEGSGIAVVESEIHKLFLRVAGTTAEVPEDAMRVFSILVSTTLRYRDQLKEDLDIVVTVEDVGVALDWLLESLRTKRLPETDNRVRLDLVKIWLQELRPYT